MAGPWPKLKACVHAGLRVLRGREQEKRPAAERETVADVKKKKMSPKDVT